MTQEQKQLLLIDLCARLPYGVIMKGVNEDFELNASTSPKRLSYVLNSADFKPYLRPMSSMTEEEKIELCTRAYAPDEMKTLDEKLYVIQTNANNATDFYNEHRLDYRGLIEKGLALKASEDMYN